MTTGQVISNQGSQADATETHGMEPWDIWGCMLTLVLLDFLKGTYFSFTISNSKHEDWEETTKYGISSNRLLALLIARWSMFVVAMKLPIQLENRKVKTMQRTANQKKLQSKSIESNVQ